MEVFEARGQHRVMRGVDGSNSAPRLLYLAAWAVGCTLGCAAVPEVDTFRGVALVHQGDWSEEVWRAFRETPWLDAASVRIKWSELEPRDQEFDWGPFDRVIDGVREYNAAHPGADRKVHLRPLGGVHGPAWFEAAGVRLYDTEQRSHVYHRDKPATIRVTTIRPPMPYDNPEFLKQLRQLYAAMRERYAKEPLVVVYHGTWSAGPWDEIFHPLPPAPMPPGYSKEKFVAGMLEQFDVLIDEWCDHGLTAELPFSGKYPPKGQIDITGPILDRIVGWLGPMSPRLVIQSNGWGTTADGRTTVSWGHEEDIRAARGKVRLAFQALGTNAGGGWHRQGDWVDLVRLAQEFDAQYVEIYPPDLMPMDTGHRIVEAFTHDPATGGTPAGLEGFTGFRPWLKARR